MTLKFGMQHWVLKYYQVWPWINLDLFYGKVKFGPLSFSSFVWEKGLKQWIFQKLF